MQSWESLDRNAKGAVCGRHLRNSRELDAGTRGKSSWNTERKEKSRRIWTRCACQRSRPWRPLGRGERTQRFQSQSWLPLPGPPSPSQAGKKSAGGCPGTELLILDQSMLTSSCLQISRASSVEVSLRACLTTKIDWTVFWPNWGQPDPDLRQTASGSAGER